MSGSATLTIRLSAETKDRLAELAGRTRSFLAADAIADHVERELTLTERIERGRADVRAGRVASHEEVSREARAIVEASRAGR